MQVNSKIMQVNSKKVHIIISGWDKERAIWGCIRLGADKVYILIPSKTNEKIEAWINEKTRNAAVMTKKKFSKFFEIELVPIIYDDYIDCFKNIIKIIKKEEGNEIFVNISSGSHVATSAAIFAASLTGCKAYYVHPERYDEIFKKEDRFISYGGRSIVEIPLLPISQTSSIELKILKKVKEFKRISISELAIRAREIFDKPTRSKFNYYINKLVENNFLKSEKIGRRIYVELTKRGEMILEAFSF
ncbi:MAG: DUF6293 family protein [Candidatus Aenigmatarchaeota archaeon]